MSQDILQLLQDKPQEIFNLKEKSGYFNLLAKSFLDPLTKEYSVLDEIYVDGLDATQVFGQTKMVLDGVGEKLLGERIPSVVERAEREEPEEEEQEEGEEPEEEEEEEVEPEEEEIEEEQEEEEIEKEPLDEEEDEDEIEDDPEEPPSYNKDSFGLNDGFFDLDNFQRAVMAMENDEDDNDEEEINYFSSLSGDDEEEDDMDYYDDFYDKPGKFAQKEVPEEEPGLNDEDAVGSAMLDLFADEDGQPEEPKNLSTFEKKKLELDKEIRRLEQEMIAEKKWTMKGEVTSTQRPDSSLLPEEVDFDRNSKEAPVASEINETLESLIRKRIMSGEFDDLQKRTMAEVHHRAERAQLSDQKSSKSLAEEYEEEYTQNVKDENEEVNKQKEEIAELFQKVSSNLDGLSSNFTTKKTKSIEIKVNEETQPLYKVGDDARGKFQLKSGLSYSKDELPPEEKKRLRRASKRKRKRVMENNPQKKPKKDNVVDTLAKAKNVTVIGKNGEKKSLGS